MLHNVTAGLKPSVLVIFIVVLGQWKDVTLWVQSATNASWAWNHYQMEMLVSRSPHYLLNCRVDYRLQGIISSTGLSCSNLVWSWGTKCPERNIQLVFQTSLLLERQSAIPICSRAVSILSVLQKIRIHDQDSYMTTTKKIVFILENKIDLWWVKFYNKQTALADLSPVL